MSKKSIYSIILFVLLIIVAMLLFKTCNIKTPISKEDSIENLSTSFLELQSSLQTRDMEKFISLTHPYIYQSVGGKKKMASYIHLALDSMEIKGPKVEEIIKFYQLENEIQVLFTNSFKIVKKNVTTRDTQRTIGFSKDNGTTWVFAGVDTKTYDELKKYIPELNESLRW